MSIVLGNIAFDEAHTSASESYAEVGGRDARKITLAGLIFGEQSIAAIDARLDALLRAASVEDYAAALSLRQGRRLWVRRESFERAIRADELVGSFTLVLEARDPYEYSETPTTHSWNVTVSGDVCVLSSGGNVFAMPAITVTAGDALINPTLDDGTRSIVYSGAVAAGQTLVFDAASRTVRLDGTDVTPYTSGDFPRIDPEETTLRYTDAATSSHLASLVVSCLDRWW
jgi:hypothetical protein